MKAYCIDRLHISTGLSYEFNIRYIDQSHREKTGVRETGAL